MNLQKAFEEAARKSQKQALEKQRDDTVNILIRVMTAAYDKSTAYSNLIMIVGYASYFTAWGKLFEKLDRDLMIFSVALMIISVLIFISWELYKMIFYATNLKDLHKVTEEKDPEEFQKKLTNHENEEKKRNLEQLKIWYIILTLSVLPAFASGFIFLYSFYLFLIVRLA